MPVFVMMSGALLLDTSKNEPLSLFYKHRASRILTPLIFWTIFYVLFTYFGKLAVYGEQVTVMALINSVLYGLPYYHLWYLYMIAGLYFFTPFLLRVIRQSEGNDLMVLCAALFVFSIAGNLFMAYFFGRQVPAIFTFIYYLPYFLAGYLIARVKNSPPLRLLWGVFIVSGALNSIGYYISFDPGRAAFNYFCNCLNITIVPMSLSIMFLLKRVKYFFISQRIVKRIAVLSLGIYAVHPFFLDLLRVIGITPERFFPLLSVPLIALLAFALSLAVSMLFAKTKGLDRTIGL
jgi:surface polysaccharide O-acyltransferase-like enzyme